MAVFCLLLTASMINRIYGRERLPKGFDLVGTLLGFSAFSTVIGSGFSVWLVMDISAEYRQLHDKHFCNERNWYS